MSGSDTTSKGKDWCLFRVYCDDWRWVKMIYVFVLSLLWWVEMRRTIVKLLQVTCPVIACAKIYWSSGAIRSPISILPLHYALLGLDFSSFFCALPKPIFSARDAGSFAGDMEVIDSTTATCMSIGGMRVLFIHTVLSLSSCVWLVVARTCLCN